MTFEALFVDPHGRTARGAFAAALVTLLAVAAFYHLLVYGRPGQFAQIVLLVPATILHARRLHDMGRSARLLLAPGVPIAAFIWLHMVGGGNGFERPVMLTALAAAIAVALWGLLGKGQAGSNRYGVPMV